MRGLFFRSVLTFRKNQHFQGFGRVEIAPGHRLDIRRSQGEEALSRLEVALDPPALGLGAVGDELAARWLVRVIVSLLIVPGRDDAEERELVERFVVPGLVPR